MLARRSTCLLGLGILLTSSSAWALDQPDGTPIPQGAGLQGLFNTRGESIDALGAAANTPETFQPGCTLTFEVLQRNAGYQNAFGWYNVTGSSPALADLHEFIKCSDAIGTITPLPNIQLDPSYLGGEIGFYQGVVTNGCTPNSGPANYAYVFYSQKEFNPDGNQANPFTHLLIYNSTVVPNAFYFGWEDLVSGGDNDFDDLTTFVTGITCSGGGAACQTGLPGVCGQGTLQCQNGTLECLPLMEPGPESCDGFDNDCNGSVDDGDLCADTEVCDDGNCVPACGSGEFDCPSDKVCDEAKGLCVDPPCLGVDCVEEGEQCIDGECVDPCNGAVCPAGQTCVAGECLDPCDGITCDPSQVCSAGACIEKCDCAGCPDGQDCQPGGLCVDTDCVDNDCPPGTVCQPDGSCKDGCDGVICPAGQTCSMGQCTDTGTEGGGGEGGGIMLAGPGGGTSDGGSPSNGGGGAAGGSGGEGSGDSGSEGGCDCRVGKPGSDVSSSFGLLIAALVVARAGRQRRKP